LEQFMSLRQIKDYNKESAMRRRHFSIAILALASALPALAVGRPFPVTARRGKMTVANFPEIYLDGKLRRLSPGARIYNTRNLIQTPGSIQGSDLVVNYTQDYTGNISVVWILTEEEAAQRLPPPKS
jgi:hypothetical protein